MPTARPRYRIHPLTMAEVLVGAGRTGPAERRRSEIQDMGVRVWTPDDAEPIRLAKLRAEAGVRLPDGCVMSTAIALNGSVATFDRRLASVASALGIPLAIGA